MMEEATEQEVPATVEATEEPQEKAEGEEQAQEGEQEQPEAQAAAAAAPEPEVKEPVPLTNPFSDADVEHMLHEEQTTAQEEGWKFMSRTEFAEIWRKSESDKPVHLIKGFLHFPGIPPNIMVDMIYNIDVRKRWDRQFPTIESVEEHEDFRVVYWLAKMPFGVADRDLVQYNTKRVDEATETTFVIYRNASHESRPPVRGVVRAETILSGSIIRADPKDPNSTRMTILLQNDVKGWVPHFIVNAISAKAPKDWRDSLANFYRNVYAKELGLVPEGGAEAKSDEGTEGGKGQEEATGGGEEATGGEEEQATGGGEEGGEKEAVVQETGGEEEQATGGGEDGGEKVVQETQETKEVEEEGGKQEGEGGGEKEEQ